MLYDERFDLQETPVGRHVVRAASGAAQILALDQLHDDGTHTAGFFKAVNVRDVGLGMPGRG